MLLLGYSTSGFADHPLELALRIITKLGYQSVALTLDYHALNPYADDLPDQLRRTRALLEALQLRSVIETGARFLLDPWRKHQPTLLSPTAVERARRLDLLERALEIAHELGADALSFWSGTALEPTEPALLMDRLVSGCRQLCTRAEERHVRLAFEPEPGMFIDSMRKYEALHQQIAHPLFGFTLDIGHLICQREVPIRPHLERWRDWLWNIHLEDMRPGVHEHLMFGDGTLDLPDVLKALEEIGYRNGVHVELSRHSHDAVNTARQAMSRLKEAQASGREES